MWQLQLCKWLLLATLLVVGGEGAPKTSPWITQIPNLDAAMEGYDSIMADPNQRPDPGMRNQIFKTLSQIEGGKVIINSFIDRAREDLHCGAELSAKIIKNYNEYVKESFSSHKFAWNADAVTGVGFGSFSFQASAGAGRESYSFQASAGAGRESFSFQASAGAGRELDEEERQLQRFFEETNGEIITTKAECITHSVGISPFVKPVFTTAFLTALKELHDASMNPQLDTSNKIFLNFVQAYGTHYMKTSYLGSKILFEKRFARKSIDVKKKMEREKCIVESAHASVEGSYKIVNAKASFSQLSDKCDNSGDNEEYFVNNNMDSEKVISIGSLPIHDLGSWAETVKDSPLPIHCELEKISTMFQADWFESITQKEDEKLAEQLNGTAMYLFFEEKSTQYCKLLLGKECPGNRIGCGYNSECPENQICRNDATQDLGYKCVDVITNIYGPVLMMSGINVKSFRLSSGEAIDTWTLPDLPVGVYGVTLTAVGSTIYSCGRHFSSGGATTAWCYKINRAVDSPRWDSAAPLPTSMYQHTSVTIKDHIWTVYSGKLYDLNTKTDNFRTFHLPLTVTSAHCAVSNGSHSFIIGAGSSHIEIWVNTEEYNPARWHRVGNLRTGRQHFGCVWFEQEVFITGGYSARDDAEVFDTLTHSSRSAGTLVQGRHDHRMMVLDGRPAVVGGWDGSTRSSSIETYDVTTGFWVTSSRSLLEARSGFGLVQLHG